MTKLHELWSELRSSSPQDPSAGYALRLLSAANDVRLYAAITIPGGLPGILIEIPKANRPRDLARAATRTFEAVIADFPGLPPERCAISIVLHQSDYADLFEMLGGDIAAAIQIAASSDDAVRAAVRRIDRWRRFVERNRRHLTDEEMRGLIGELAVLARATAKFGAHRAVTAWQGLGGLRDFELPDFSVEAKTYQAETGAAVRINDPQQLEGSLARPVYLAVVRLARSEAQGYSLPETVSIVEQLLLSDQAALEEFRDRLASYGYISTEAAQYTDRFVISHFQLFAAGGSFPRIPVNSVPTGVRNVHFSVLLSAAMPYVKDAPPLIGDSSVLEAD
jgi:hypothetical protein